ncbi:MAG: ATP-binding protein [Butyrivibrio sp.]|nr:ATP-binding protein [Butyrivibrio sp.]
MRVVGYVGYWTLFIVGVIVLINLCTKYNYKQVLYYSIISLAVQHVAFDICEISDSIFGRIQFVDVIIYILIYGVFAFVLRKFFSRMEPKNLGQTDLVPIITIVMIVLFVSVMYKGNSFDEFEFSWNYVYYRIVDALCCIYILWTQGIRRLSEYYASELDGINKAFLIQKEQYRIRQETIDSINRKCHDLKHQIEAIHHMDKETDREAYYKELKKDIMIYDMAIDTGNEALNILMMDKGRYCLDHDIQLTCMADAGSLSFMKLEDVYAIFGNALDNAITAVEKLEDKEKRVINLKVLNQNNMFMVQLQNYYDGIVSFEDGMPVTTKLDKENHGFGVKSIRYLAEKYGGTTTVNAKDGIFTLQILLPVGK